MILFILSLSGIMLIIIKMYHIQNKYSFIVFTYILIKENVLHNHIDIGKNDELKFIYWWQTIKIWTFINLSFI